MNAVTPLALLEAARAKTPHGYVDELLAAGRVEGELHVVDAATLDAVRARYGLPPAKRLPSLGRQAANAGKAMLRVATALVTGQPVLVPEAVREARLAICEACEHYLPEHRRCSRCGCKTVGQIVNKTRLATEQCPDGRWGHYKPGQEL